MSKKMLVESDPHETRIAVLESDRLTEVFLERHGRRGIVGNIYKGRVRRVLPGMQAAFVDIGLDRDAFLYAGDIVQLGDEDDEASEAEVEEPPPLPEEDEGESRRTPPAIEELLVAGEELVVQVTKDALPNKGARVTTHITLPYRYLVLLPTVRHFGVSRRIEQLEERDRLRELLEEIAGPDHGYIVRTAGEDRGLDEFLADRDYLCHLWARIEESAARVRSPTLLHREADLALRVVRDLFTDQYSVLWVDGEETYQRIVEFLHEVQPGLVSRVKLDRQEAALFERFGIEDAIEAALQTKVWLKSGGHLAVNQTEALVAIDVNTGRFVGQQNLADTILQTNLEAIEEVVRQIRLRDLSGIIIIDLIDMEVEEHRHRVFAALEQELTKDRAKHKVLNISEFGLVELTRKRSHTNLERLLTTPCPYCQGKGRIKNLTTICLNIRRAVLRQGRGSARELLLRVHPEVAAALQTHERSIFEELERHLGSSILLQSDEQLHHETFDLIEV